MIKDVVIQSEIFSFLLSLFSSSNFQIFCWSQIFIRYVCTCHWQPHYSTQYCSNKWQQATCCHLLLEWQVTSTAAPEIVYKIDHHLQCHHFWHSSFWFWAVATVPQRLSWKRKSRVSKNCPQPNLQLVLQSHLQPQELHCPDISQPPFTVTLYAEHRLPRFFTP